MKKMLLVLGLMLSLVSISKADTNVVVTPSTSTSSMQIVAGPLTLMVPVKSGLQVTYLYDAIGRQSLLGLETPFIRLKALPLGNGKLTLPAAEVTFGGIISQHGNGAPFIGGNLDISQYLPASLNLGDNVKVGGWGGRDFVNKVWMAGMKTSYQFKIPGLD